MNIISCGNLDMSAITSCLQPSSLRRFFTISQSSQIQIFVEDCWQTALAYSVSLDSPISSLNAAIEEAEGKLVGKHYPLTKMSLHNPVTSSTAMSRVSGPTARRH